MTRADRRAWAWALGVACIRAAARRRFHGVYLAGRHHLENLDSSRPAIACANHSNWWDGYAAALVTAAFPSRTGYLAQEERFLKMYPFHRWIGAFGIDFEGSPLPGLREALRLLRRPGTLMWLFPQGRLEPPGAPIRLRRGASWLAERSGAVLIPVALRYDWRLESRPGLYIRIGVPAAPADDLGASITALLEQGPPHGPGEPGPDWERLLASSLSAQSLWDRLSMRNG